MDIMINPNQNTHNPYSAGQVYEFPPVAAGDAGATVRIVKASEGDTGLRYRMDELAARADAGPLADDCGGCVYVQTSERVGNTQVPRRYYFDREAVVQRDNSNGVRTGQRVRPDEMADPGSDIVVGSTWKFTESPAEVVSALAWPYVEGTLDGGVQPGRPGMTAPTLRGRELLDGWKIDNPQ